MLDFLKVKNPWQSWIIQFHTLLMRGSVGGMGECSRICPPFKSANVRQDNAGTVKWERRGRSMVTRLEK